jgi:hypothetical protein
MPSLKKILLLTLMLVLIVALGYVGWVILESLLFL